MILYNLCGSAKECLNQMYVDQDIAVATSIEYFRCISLVINTNIYCVLENGFSSKHLVHFLLRKDFELMSELNRFISMANEGGLISKWMVDLSSKHVTQHQDTIRMEISMTHMISLLITCGPLIFIAILTLFVEFLVHKQNTKLNAGKFWSFANLMIDPERHFLNYDLRFALPISYTRHESYDTK